MMPTSPLTHRIAAPLLGIAAVVGVAACGSDDAALDLPEAAQEGRTIANSNGCAACHGTDGQGGVGPAYQGLFGSEVEFEDGETLVADRAYLRESIVDPSARRVAGFRARMPDNPLRDDEVDAVVEYIVALADVGDDS